MLEVYVPCSAELKCASLSQPENPAFTIGIDHQRELHELL